jgi:hypothetical protein
MRPTSIGPKWPERIWIRGAKGKRRRKHYWSSARTEDAEEEKKSGIPPGKSSQIE